MVVLLLLLLMLVMMVQHVVMGLLSVPTLMTGVGSYTTTRMLHLLRSRVSTFMTIKAVGVVMVRLFLLLLVLRLLLS